MHKIIEIVNLKITILSVENIHLIFNFSLCYIKKAFKTEFQKNKDWNSAAFIFLAPALESLKPNSKKTRIETWFRIN